MCLLALGAAFKVGIMVVVILTPSIGRETRFVVLTPSIGDETRFVVEVVVVGGEAPKFVVKAVVVVVLFTGREIPATAASLLRTAFVLTK